LYVELVTDVESVLIALTICEIVDTSRGWPLSGTFNIAIL
jgi:hypothetical protein